jgi:hypothetical protein
MSRAHSGAGRRIAFIDNVFLPDIPVGQFSISSNSPQHSGSWISSYKLIFKYLRAAGYKL